METNETIKIMQALANGTDPITGEVFPDSSPYNHPKVIRALFQTLKALERSRGREERERPATPVSPGTRKKTAISSTASTPALQPKRLLRDTGAPNTRSLRGL